MTPHVERLLTDLAEARRTLEIAPNPEAAADARATIQALQHSLWLAGHHEEEVA